MSRLFSSPLLPVLPLDLQEVLLPGQTRHLHLYEARFLSLLERSQRDCDSQVLLGLMHGDSGMLKLGVLAKLESTTREDVGVGVDLRAIKAVQIRGLTVGDDRPYMQARCEEEDGESTGSVASEPEGEEDESILSNVIEVWSSVRSLLSKADLRNHELRVDPRSFDSHVEERNADEGDLIMRSRAAAGACRKGINPDRESVKEFASWLCFEGSGIGDKIKALEAKGTDERLGIGLTLLREREKVLAAKVAIKSAFDEN